MFESEEAQRAIGRSAWVMAWVGLVVGQLHALARHNTVDGRGDLSQPLTRWWSDPARSALRPLLDWASPDTVYVTYGKIWLPVFLAFTLCAVLVRRRCRPAGFERWAWRVALTGYVWACAAVAGDYWTQWPGTPASLVDVFFVLGLPGLLLTLVGSTMLGIAMLRTGSVARLPAWLLTLTIPTAVVVLQFTSMGSAALAVMIAFGLLGRRIARQPLRAPHPVAAPATA